MLRYCRTTHVAFSVDDQRTQGQQLFVDALNHFLADEQLASTGANHRVVNDMARTIAAEHIDNDVEHFLGAYQSNLHHLRLHVVHHGFYLTCHNMCRYVIEFLNAQCGLGGDACHCRHGMTTQSRHRVDVRLYSGFTHRVGTGNGQYRSCYLLQIICGIGDMVTG